MTARGSQASILVWMYYTSVLVVCTDDLEALNNLSVYKFGYKICIRIGLKEYNHTILQYIDIDPPQWSTQLLLILQKPYVYYIEVRTRYETLHVTVTTISGHLESSV